MRNFLSGRECCRSSRFPRVTMCDFEIRTMADHIHKHTIQVGDEDWPYWCFYSTLVRASCESIQWENLHLHLVLASHRLYPLFLWICHVYLATNRSLQSWTFSEEILENHESYHTWNIRQKIIPYILQQIPAPWWCTCPTSRGDEYERCGDGRNHGRTMGWIQTCPGYRRRNLCLDKAESHSSISSPAQNVQI